MKALELSRKPVRYAAASIAGRVVPGRGARFGPLRMVDVDAPELPGPDWVRVRPRLAGICGSDLATLDGHSSRYFEPLVSFPFTPGHEVVGELDDGSRVVIEPVLGCTTRHIEPPCPACADGRLGNCERVTFGALASGLQSGYCRDTGGGWSTTMVAHTSQIHAVPAAMSDAAAVMVEPAACAVHGALAAQVGPGQVAVVLGAGTLGLLTIAALRRFAQPGQLIAVAKHPHQRRWAAELGADVVVAPDEIARAVRRATGTMAITARDRSTRDGTTRDGNDGQGAIVRLCGGADVVVDCVGSEASLAQALTVVRPRGRIALLGMPAAVNVDLAGLWQREVTLAGAYAYGTEQRPDGSTPRTFALAFQLVQGAALDRLLSATYPLDRYEEAVEHAADAGRRGAVKVAFDMREERHR